MNSAGGSDPRIDVKPIIDADEPWVGAPLSLRVDEEVIRAMRRHVDVDTSVEQGGVLVGRVDGETGTVTITASVPAFAAVSRAASLTFTHDTWDRVNAIVEEQHPHERIVGWYHSHPHFGVFLSSYDQFIHQNFFSQPWHVAYVVDPLLGQDGFFGWRQGEIVRLGRWDVSVSGADADRAVGEPPPSPSLPASPGPGSGKIDDRTRRPGWTVAFGGLLVGLLVGVIAGVFVFGGNHSASRPMALAVDEVVMDTSLGIPVVSVNLTAEQPVFDLEVKVAGGASPVTVLSVPDPAVLAEAPSSGPAVVTFVLLPHPVDDGIARQDHVELIVRGCGGEAGCPIEDRIEEVHELTVPGL